MDSASTYAELLRAAREARPSLAIVLGSGMGDVIAAVEPVVRVYFTAIPGLGESSVVGHRGRLTLGRWSGKAVLIFEGRLHYYEGYSWETVVRPVHVARELGAETLLLTNAAGGIAGKLRTGSLMVITDQIEWNQPGFWRQLDEVTARPVRAHPYSPRLIELLGKVGRSLDIDLAAGVYAAVTGPSYETPAEIRALRWCGADAVGMSTAREAATAHDLGMEVAGLSCITNKAAGLSGQPLAHEEVLATAKAQSATLSRLLARFVAEV